MKVSMLNRPTNLPTPRPSSLVWISPWYQAKPNGAFGTWITKKSNSVSGGKPLTRTRMFSTGPIDPILTRARAFARHPAASAAADRTMLNRIVLGSPAPRAANGVVTTARTTAVAKISFHLLQTVDVLGKALTLFPGMQTPLIPWMDWTRGRGGRLVHHLLDVGNLEAPCSYYGWECGAAHPVRS